MEITTVLIALVVCFIAWKLLMGLIKFGAIALIVLGAGYVLTNGTDIGGGFL
jgi:hypothetical protein